MQSASSLDLSVYRLVYSILVFFDKKQECFSTSERYHDDGISNRIMLEYNKIINHITAQIPAREFEGGI